MKERSLFAGRPALTAILLFILGIFISLSFPISYSVPLILLVVSLFALTVFYLKGKMRAAAYLAATTIIILGWYLTKLQSGPFPANHIENLAGQGGRVELIGKVVDEPDIRSDRTYLVIEVDSLYRNRIWIPTFGRLRAKIKEGGLRYQHADIVKLNGFLYQPEGPRNPGSFDYKAYLRNKEIFAAISVSGPDQVTTLSEGSSLLSSVISPLRTWLVTRTREYLSPLSSALLSGFILGEQRDIPEEYQDLFRNTGTLHLMAVSGSNVGLVLIIFAFPLTILRVPRPIKVVILMIVVLFFAILTRLQPSVVRASIMAAIGLIAYGWIRKPDYINLLSLAGLLMLLWRPLQLFDVGVELSFAATFGIIYAVPKVNSWLSFLKGRWGGYLRNFLIVIASTIAAQAAVMPLMAHYFQNLPLSGILANIPMIFLASLTTILGVAFYFLNILGGWLAQLISFPLGWTLYFTVEVLRFFAELPFANIHVASTAWPLMVLFWLLLYFGFELIAKRRLSKFSLVVVLLVSNIFIWGQLFKPRADWSLEFLDLGRNHAWIYSGNNQPTVACYDCFVSQDDVENILLPHLLNHHKGELDYLFTSTPDSTAIGELCSIFNPKMVSFSRGDSGQNTTQLTHLANCTYPVQSNFPANIKVFWKKSDNMNGYGGLLPALVAGNGTLILADWTGAEILDGLNFSRTRLMELPWSAYAQSSCLKAIERVDPDIVIFSPDRYSQAMPREREKLTHSAGRVLATSLFGGISISGADTVITIETMKPVFTERK